MSVDERAANLARFTALTGIRLDNESRCHRRVLGGRHIGANRCDCMDGTGYEDEFSIQALDHFRSAVLPDGSPALVCAPYGMTPQDFAVVTAWARRRGLEVGLIPLRLTHWVSGTTTVVMAAPGWIDRWASGRIVAVDETGVSAFPIRPGTPSPSRDFVLSASGAWTGPATDSEHVGDEPEDESYPGEASDRLRRRLVQEAEEGRRRRAELREIEERRRAS